MITQTMSETAISAQSGLEHVLHALRPKVPEIRRRWTSAQPFHYVVIDEFLPDTLAQEIYDSYPLPDIEGWDKITYAHQKKKFTMHSGFPTPIERFFKISAEPEFRNLLTEMTGIANLLDDPSLLGGGLHQILRGGFLDLHVDYNFHPETKLHRRLNLLVYMNKDWKSEYEGYLELWDLGKNKRQIEHIAPLFNRAVIFETNEVSVHGHPRPLATPQDKSRKSLALYYYTTERDVVAPEHNTLYHQSTGFRGYVKTAISSTQAAMERVRDKGSVFLALDVADKLRRRLLGLPPANR